MLLVVACKTAVIYLLLFVSDFCICSRAKEAIILERLILQHKRVISVDKKIWRPKSF